MAPRSTLYFVGLALQVLRGGSVDVGAIVADFAADDVEEGSMCLLQDATALLQDVVVRSQFASGAAQPPREALIAEISQTQQAAHGPSPAHESELGLMATKSGLKGTNSNGGHKETSGKKKWLPKEATRQFIPDGDVTLLEILSVVLVVVPLVGLITYVVSKWGFMRGDEEPSQRGGDREQAEVRKNENMDEDTYSFAVASLVRDAQRFARSEKNKLLFLTRCGYSLLLLFATMVVQAGLVLQVKLYVTPQQVAAIRESYDAYEFHMYGGVESHTTLTVNGKHRGIPGYFQPELFDTLDGDLQSEVCNIPMSRMTFFGMILFVWSLTCIAQIRKAWNLFQSLVVTTPTIDLMADCLIAADTDDEGGGGNNDEHVCSSQSLRRADTQYLYGDNVVIVGLTAPVKAAVAMFVVVPWVSTTAFLLWLGCRWLTATNDFGNLIGNAVALEFILYFKDLTYMALVSERNKREVQTTKLLPDARRERANFMVYMGTFVWGLIVLGWMWAYVYHLQRVLPEYRWDVNVVCGKWFADLLARPDQ